MAVSRKLWKPCSFLMLYIDHSQLKLMLWISLHPIVLHYWFPPSQANLVHVAAKEVAIEPLAVISADYCAVIAVELQQLGNRCCPDSQKSPINTDLLEATFPTSVKANIPGEPLWFPPFSFCEITERISFSRTSKCYIQIKSSTHRFEIQEF